MRKKCEKVFCSFHQLIVVSTVSQLRMCMMKNKFYARLSVEHNLRVCLSKTLPRIDLLVKQSQAHSFNQIYEEMIKAVKNTFCDLHIQSYRFSLNFFKEYATHLGSTKEYVAKKV